MTIQERAQELSRLEEFFKKTPKPAGSIIIVGFMRLGDVQTFIDTNITRAGSNMSSISSEACILRLQQLEHYMSGSLPG